MRSLLFDPIPLLAVLVVFAAIVAAAMLAPVALVVTIVAIALLLALTRSRRAQLAAMLLLGLVFAPALALAAPQVNVIVTVGVQGHYTNRVGAAAQDALVANRLALNFLTGTGVNQAGKVYAENVSIAASSSENDDLTTVLDALGTALGLTAVKAVVLCADATNTNSIVVGNAGSNPWSAPFDAATDTITIPAGGCAVLLNPTAGGWTVDSTHKVLKLANSSSGTAVTGKLYVIGL